jgi:hypothetical protein
MHLTKDMEHVNLFGILWYIHMYRACNIALANTVAMKTMKMLPMS